MSYLITLLKYRPSMILVKLCQDEFGWWFKKWVTEYDIFVCQNVKRLYIGFLLILYYFFMEKFYINKSELREIRDNCDWWAIINSFGLRVDYKKSNWKDVFVWCPWTEETNASLHININTWAWCNFSGARTNENGWPIEFVQVYMRNITGEVLNCYKAGRMLVERGASSLSGGCLVGSPSSHHSHHNSNKHTLTTKPRTQPVSHARNRMVGYGEMAIIHHRSPLPSRLECSTKIYHNVYSSHNYN